MHHQFLHCCNSTKLYKRIQNLFLLVQLLVGVLFLFQRVRKVDPPCYVTVDVYTVKNAKHSSLCYKVNSVTSVKVCNFFVPCQSVCEVDPIHFNIAHVTTDSIMKYRNEISL